MPPYENRSTGLFSFFLLLIVLFGLILLTSDLGDLGDTLAQAEVVVTPETQAINPNVLLPLTGQQGTITEVQPIQQANPVPVVVCSDVYTVAVGDTLNQVAVKCNTTVVALLQANTQFLDANLIAAGQTLYIPARAAAVGGGIEGPVVYIVQPGDTLSSIAARYNVDVADLLAANPGIGDTSLIMLGQQLFIPQNVNLPNTGSVLPAVLVAPSSGSPGTLMTVTGSGLPANTGLNLGLGLSGSAYTILSSVLTDAFGQFAAQVMIPVEALPGQSWVVAAFLPDGNALAVSNTFLVTTPSVPPVVLLPDTGAHTYEVQPGETLGSIAARFNTTWQEIWQANPQIKDPRLIQPGLTLVIP